MEKKGEEHIKIYDNVMENFQGNPYVFFLLRQIDQELEKMLNSEEESSKAEYEPYEIMWIATDENIPFIQIAFSDKDQFVDHVMGIFTGFSVDELSGFTGNRDQSWMLRRADTLKKEFSQRIKIISEMINIPIQSTIKMYHILVYFMGYNDFTDDMHEKYPEPPDDFWQIYVPSGLSTDEKENLVVQVWHEIRKLFIECMHVFIFTGGIECLYLTGLYQNNGLEITKTRLLATGFDTGITASIQGITSQDELQKFFLSNFFCFIDALRNIVISFNTYKDKTARKKIKMVLLGNAQPDGSNH